MQLAKYENKNQRWSDSQREQHKLQHNLCLLLPCVYPEKAAIDKMVLAD